MTATAPLAPSDSRRRSRCRRRWLPQWREIGRRTHSASRRSGLDRWRSGRSLRFASLPGSRFGRSHPVARHTLLDHCRLYIRLADPIHHLPARYRISDRLIGSERVMLNKLRLVIGGPAVTAYLLVLVLFLMFWDMLLDKNRSRTTFLFHPLFKRFSRQEPTMR